MSDDRALPPRSGSSWGRGVLVAGLGLVALTVWAFSEDTTPEFNDAGVRVDPGDVYNPVVAGEPLPPGFRQLLPRDAIRPVYDPQFLEADAIGWTDDTDVIGVVLGDEAKAYPVDFLNGRELVVDEIDQEPILVSW